MVLWLDIFLAHLVELRDLDPVRLLQTLQNFHGLVCLALRAQFRSLLDFSSDFLVVFHKLNQHCFLRDLLATRIVFLEDDASARHLLAHKSGHLLLVELLLHLNRTHREALAHMLVVRIVAHELSIHHPRLHWVHELTVHRWGGAHLHLGLALRHLLALHLRHLPVLLEHIVRVHHRLHRHAHHRSAHLRSHLARAFLLKVALVHTGLNIYWRLRSDVTVSMRKRASV